MLHAVSVGVNTYADPRVLNLSCARQDAEAFARLIEQRVAPEERAVRLLVDEEATRENVQVAIGEDLSRAVGPEDVVLLYFACHGSPEMRASKDERSLYLILHDTQYPRIYATGVDMEIDVMRWMHRLGDARLVVLFIDACFSGRAGGRTFKGPLAAKTYRSEPRKVSLKDLALGSGRLIITAADEDQVAMEEPGLGHGVFTYHLLRALQPTAAEPATIKVGVLYETVATAVAQATDGRQVPILNGQSRMAALPALPTP
ncbi:uncharacterized protein SOCE26_025030 [Sorangium cellulosum]|uniref:Peptidase C14 caspase domain-containing protein n=1 Tax=Sorangium cellulosum TaxID=56 RepID=A0A2L0EP73_SORCE|nr:caspase family protein [Sorangium cellulosum]AUX41098.1 uncharacterized protein SOCE26_025030 [Sorangium cellulosum]